MYSYGDLVEQFNKYCEDIMATFPEVLDNIGGPEAETITVMTENIHSIATWWDGPNKQDYINQRYVLEAHDPNYLEDMTLQGVAELQENEFHAAFFDEQVTIARENDFDDFFFEKFIPHEVGVHGCGYGSALRDTAGYKQLDFMCKTMGETEIVIRYTNDTEVNDLPHAFRLAVEIRSTDGVPLSKKLSQPRMQGFFDLNKMKPN